MKLVLSLLVLTGLHASAHGLTRADLERAPAVPRGLHTVMTLAERTVSEVVGADYPAQYFDQLVSHARDGGADASGDSQVATFRQRYWFDATDYIEGGPVYLLEAGETDGAGRLPFMSRGILKKLAQATGGLSIVLEHRYYGESFPIVVNSTDSFRYLTTLESMLDSVRFAQKVVVPGLEHVNLTRAAWINYGGSYAGAKVAFLRKLYPVLL